MRSRQLIGIEGFMNGEALNLAAHASEDGKAFEGDFGSACDELYEGGLFLIVKSL